MKKKLLIAGLLIFVFLGLACLITLAYSAEFPNILVIGVDAGDELWLDRLGASTLPNMFALTTKTSTQTFSVTCTNPGWAQIWTGLAPAQSGVWDNINNDIFISYKKSLPYLLQQQGYQIGWFSSKPYTSRDEGESSIFKIGQNADVYLRKEPRTVGPKYLNLFESHAMNFMTSTPSPWMLFIHGNPDAYGHCGNPCNYQIHPYSAIERQLFYLNEYERIDRMLGRLKGYADVVIVVSDHGWDKGEGSHFPQGHKFAPHSFMLTNQRNVSRYMNLIDIPVYILKLVGLEKGSWMWGN